MWYCVHIVQVVWCMYDAMYMLCRWCHVHVMLCTCCVGVLCTGGTVYMLYKWYWCISVHVVHDVLQACGTMNVHCVVVVS